MRPAAERQNVGGRQMLLWETMKAEFAWEGSWRDICVPEVDLDGWQAAMSALEASGHTGKLAVGESASSTPVDVSKLFGIEDRANVLWSTKVAGVVLACHFFSETEIEFDLDPREVRGQVEIAAQGLAFCDRQRRPRRCDAATCRADDRTRRIRSDAGSRGRRPLLGIVAPAAQQVVEPDGATARGLTPGR